MTVPLLALFAHPDDETFAAAGVLAAAVEHGHPAVVVSATRGEMGESAIPGLEDPDRLGSVREEELRAAMAAVGINDVRFLGYRDSGMEGSAAAADPRAFIQAPVSAVAAQVALLIRAIRPGIVLTFGPEGLYGHPDHLHMHEAALRALALAADPSPDDASGLPPWHVPTVYFATFPREELLPLFAESGGMEALSPQAMANLGVPRAEITHQIDVSPWAEQKRNAVRAHRTQTAEGGPLHGRQAEFIERQLMQEHFVRAPLSGLDDDTGDILAFLAKRQAAP